MNYIEYHFAPDYVQNIKMAANDKDNKKVDDKVVEEKKDDKKTGDKKDGEKDEAKKDLPYVLTLAS
jgi:hypothetical protein